jgi:hypothetical protein
MVALSIIWAVGAGICTHNADVKRAERFAKVAYKVCTDGKKLKHDPDLSSCDTERTKHLAEWMAGTWIMHTISVRSLARSADAGRV